MLIAKQKREPRRARQQSAWIMFDDDFVSHECRVLDVSMNGAKLVAEINVAIGSTLRLSTVPHALVRQRCKVAWRRGKTFGVQFVGEIN
jgi:PilZ domain